MAHTSEVVAWKKVSNGQFVYVIRCCGDPSTDHPHTIGIDVADRAASLKEAQDFVEAQHEKSQQIADEAIQHTLK